MSDKPYLLLHGDCLEQMRALRDSSIDAVVSDPPYGFSFMGKGWDHGVPGEAYWREAFRVLKPGAHLVAFGGPRTYHRLACAIEDAGFEVRDSLHWIFGQGFPKSLNVSKALDKAAGAERKFLRDNPNSRPNMVRVEAIVLSPRVDAPITAPATDLARQWDGWGTALKPAHEPIILARKPLSGTVAANIVEHGTGALAIDACRVGTDSTRRPLGSVSICGVNAGSRIGGSDSGRYPPNFLLSHLPECGDTCADGCAVDELGRQSGVSKAKPERIGAKGGNRGSLGAFAGSTRDAIGRWPEDPGGTAARFFPCFRYQAKASRGERNAGLPDGERSTHPTVKPIDLMRWLVRLVTPPGGVVLDPFMGSGSTGCAAVQEGARFVGIEREAEYLDIARARIAHWFEKSEKPPTEPVQPDLFAEAS